MRGGREKEHQFEKEEQLEEEASAAAR